MRRFRWAAAVVVPVGCFVAVGCSSSAAPSRAALSALSAPTGPPISRPMAPPQILTEESRTVTVARGHSFEIQLPQGLQAGSWSYAEKSGPLKLTGKGSDVLGADNGIQTFDFEAVSAGTEDLSFTYLDGTPRGPNSVTFTITVR